MTVENVKKVREMANKSIVKVVTDNQHIFYDNAEGQPEIIWDDTKERFICFRNNQNQYTQTIMGVDITITEYANIQYMTILEDKKESLRILNDLKVELSLSDKEVQKTIKFIESCNHNKFANT